MLSHRLLFPVGPRWIGYGWGTVTPGNSPLDAN